MTGTAAPSSPSTAPSASSGTGRARRAFFIGLGMIYPALVVAIVAPLFDYFWAGIFEEASGLVILYLPLLTLIAVVRPHFRAWMAAAPVAIVIVDSAIAIAFGPSFVDVLAMISAPVFSPVAPNVLGKTLLVLAAPILCAAVALVGQRSLFRLIMVIAGGAQILTLLLFHYAALTWPMTGLDVAERTRVAATLERDGDLDALCALPTRACHTGGAASAAAWARESLPVPSRALSLIADTGARERLLFTWIERPAPDIPDPIAAITAFKPDADTYTLMAEIAPVSEVYTALQLGSGVLIAAFQQAWTILVLAVLWRHGDRVRRRGRWVPPAAAS